MVFALLLALVVAVADQLVKDWVLHFFAARALELPVVPVVPVFNLVLTWNHGMSFGLFNNDNTLNGLVFAGVAAVIVLGLLIWLRRAQSALIRVAIGLVIGGAIGNVYDRLTRGAVVDFLDFHLGAWHWFAFNLADAAICIGVVLMLIDSLLGRRETPN